MTSTTALVLTPEDAGTLASIAWCVGNLASSVVHCSDCRQQDRSTSNLVWRLYCLDHAEEAAHDQERARDFLARFPDLAPYVAHWCI